MKIVKSKDKMQSNCYDWQGVSTGKMMMLAQLCKMAKDNHPLSEECYFAIRNAFFENDRESYDYIEKL